MHAGAPLLTPEQGPRKRNRTFPDQDPLTQRGTVSASAYRLLRSLPSGHRLSLAIAPDGATVVLKTGHDVVIDHERWVLARLRHPGVVRLIDSFTDDPSTVLVLEHLEGGDLVSLAGSAAVHWCGAALDLIGTLEYLHANGLVHRDLKSRHVMFDRSGVARLIDFGSVVAIGAAWQDAGTTPEVVDPFRSGPVSVSDDIYAFAVILHELLHGQLPAASPPGEQGCLPKGGANPTQELERLVRAVLTDPTANGRPELAEFRNCLQRVGQRN